MSELYDIVKKVIEAKSIEESKQLLYGYNGISINSKEYYQKIISSFIKKKENIIKKINGKLVFDLNNVNDLWSCVFISEYIKENDLLYKEYNRLLEEINIINNDLIKIKNKHKSAITKEEHSNINREYQLLKKTLDLKMEMLDKLKNVSEIFFNIDWVVLENENDSVKQLQSINILKQAICIIHKLRNSFEHDAIQSEEIIKIEGNNFHFTIPAEYIDGFNKGKIIARERDMIIVNKTNDIVYPILEELNYDYNKLANFFYNIEPNYLSYILELCDNDVQKLYKLSGNIFLFQQATELFLKNNLDINFISSLPRAAFNEPTVTLSFIEIGIDVTKLPNNAFYYPTHAKTLFDAEYDITKLPEEAFLNADKENYTLFSKNKIKHKETISNLNNLKILYEAKIDVQKLSYYAVINAKNVVILKNIGIDVTKLPDEAFLYLNNTITLKNFGLDVTKLPGMGFVSVDNTLLLLNAGIDITKISNKAFVYPENAIQLKKMGIDTTSLPDYAFININKSFDLINAGIDITKVPTGAFIYPENAIQLKNAGIDITTLPEPAFINSNKTLSLLTLKIDLLNLPKHIIFMMLGNYYYDGLKINLDIDSILLLKNKGINIAKIPEEAFIYIDNTILLSEEKIDLEKIPRDSFANPTILINLKKENIDVNKLFLYKNINVNDIKIENIKYILLYIGNDYSKLEQFPDEFLTCDFNLLENMLQQYNNNISKSIFGIENPKIIATLLYANSVFSQYQKENKDDELIDIDPVTIIHSSFNSSYTYRNNIVDSEFNHEKYLEQFIVKDEYNHRTIEELKMFILDKLRNFSAHFRFKLVKDTEGNLVENKVYIYDRYDELAENNFNMIIDIKDLVEITRQVELGLKLKNKSYLNTTEEENRFKKR